MKQHLRRAIAAIAIIGLAACGGSDDAADTTQAAGATTAVTGGADTTATSPSPTTPPATGDSGTTAAVPSDGCVAGAPGGEMTMGMFSQPRSLDPLVGGPTGRSGAIEMAAIYDTLLRFDPATGEYSPRVALSAEPNADFTEWTVALRPGVTFGNGDALTADDVRAHFERAKGPDNLTSYKFVAQMVDTVEVIDEHTVRFDLTRPWAQFRWVLASTVGMIENPRVVAAMGNEAFGAMPTGAGVGPYEVSEFTAGEVISLTAKDAYWAGRACIQSLHFEVVPGSQPTYEAFTTGQLQAAMITEFRVIDAAKDDGVEALSYTIGGGKAVAFNTGKAPTDDVRVRRAITLAIDPQQIDERVNDGTGQPTSSFYLPDNRLYPGVDGPVYDPDEARRLVTEVIAEGNWDGSLELISTDARDAVDESLVIKSQLDAVGFNVTTRAMATPALSSAVAVDRTFQLAIWANAIRDDNPLIAFNQLTDTPANYYGYRNAAFDAAVLDVSKAPDDDALRSAIGELQQIWNDNPPMAVYNNVEVFVAFDDSVHGAQMTADHTVVFTEAYID
jgi:peptide/nickel transport system substrate-binding protein